MAPIITDLYNRFKKENIAGQFIYINIAVFLFVAIVKVVAILFNMPNIDSWFTLFELPSLPHSFIVQPWSIITYMFMHSGIAHLLWNMLALYIFGRIFLSVYSSRHFLGLYFLGGVLGGGFFFAAYNLLPYFENSYTNSYLVGASASVLAIVMATAIRIPEQRVSLLFFGSIRMITLAFITVLISLLLVTSDNAGGNIAHIGGAFAGWLFAYALNKGYDLTLYINKIADFVTTLCKVDKWRKMKKPKMRIYKGKRDADYNYNAGKKANEKELDVILEKIKKSGYGSLTDEERKKLFDTSGN